MERTKRNYNKFFIFQTDIFQSTINYLLFQTQRKSQLVLEPEIEVNHCSPVLFFKIPHWEQYFQRLQPYRKEIRQYLFSAITIENLNLINQLKTVDVAVHVRLGDFKKLQQGSSFAQVGSTRTPVGFFIESINKIKLDHPNYKFWIFSDGFKHEVEDLLELESVEFFESINDIVDLFQMAKSKILVASAGSTYSYWAAFLGDCEIVQHPDHEHNLF
jgi:hypothetical protein